MLLTSISLVTAHVHAQATPPTDRKVHKTEQATLVATPHLPLVAVHTTPAAVVIAPATTTSDLAQLASPIAGRKPGQRCQADEALVPPNYADSLHAGDIHQATEPKQQLRPDPDRHRKGYNYR